MRWLSAYIIALVPLLISVQVDAQDRSRRERMELYDEVEDASEIRPGEDIDDKIRKNFFLRADVSKTDCFVGEPVMAVFKAYSRVDANSQVVKRPSLSGFSVVEMVDAYNNQPNVEKYNNAYYYTHLIRKVQLFPLQAGDFTLESAEVESLIQLRNADEPDSRLRLRNLFRRQRADPSLQRQMLFKTPEVIVHVNPLPEQGQPGDFGGAVGKFRVELAMDDTTVSRHEASKIYLRIVGEGNFPLITDPQVQWPGNMQAAGPIVTEDVNKYEFPLSGTKTFEYTIDNRDTGSFLIPAVQFSYFDPEDRSYKTVASDTLRYTVSESDNTEKTIPLINVSQKSDTPLHYYYFGIVVVVIIVVILYVLLKRQT
jgi:hypothetical protein